MGARGQLADFVQEERSPISFFEQPLTIADRAGKGAARVAKKFRLEEIVGERGAVHRAEPPLPSRAETVDGAGDEFLPAAALSFDQDRKWCTGRASDGLTKPAGHRGGSDQFTARPVGDDGVRTIQEAAHGTCGRERTRAHDCGHAMVVGDGARGPAATQRGNRFAAIPDGFCRATRFA